MVIGDVHVYPGHPCPHSTGKGCDDYESRPVDPCHEFNCGWVVNGSPLPDWFKPDNAKVIMIFNKAQWQGIAIDVAVPVGKRIPPRSLKWLMEFAQKHGRPLLYAEQHIVDGIMQPQQNFSAYGPPAFRDYVQQLKPTASGCGRTTPRSAHRAYSSSAANMGAKCFS
jgi:hypothetical protein